MATTRLQRLDRRYLDILEVGGPRKVRILKALAPSEEAFASSMARLKRRRLVKTTYRNGGPHIALRGRKK